MGADVVVVCEQYRNRDYSSWYVEDLGAAALRRSRVPGKARRTGIIAGDFNARPPEWEMPTSNARGKLVMEMVSRLGLIVLNSCTTPTYQRPGFGVSIPDVTLVSEFLGRQTRGSKVMEDFTGNNHQYITFRISSDGSALHGRSRRPLGWNTAKRDEGKFTECMSRGLGGIPPIPRDHPGRNVAEAMVSHTMGLITRTCDASMPRKKPWKGRAQAYWWTGQIASLRRKCLRLRRLAQRARRRTEPSDRRTSLSPARSGTAAQGTLGAATTERVVDGLFPNNPARDFYPEPVDGDVVPTFTLEELQSAVGSLKPRKAPGPDGILAQVLKMVA
ncbi:uncharacterized protein LOC128892659 [Hylaeus anthracinus]|uniref:uncharacterized protein LOC128892659 n=1 Tax=Hylaeus anthracinus TaxID=313031 RepID=UPI0023BA230F|nr:uncharacterized protein LOC128892659 [Hylaeus anthracinus]